MENEVFKRDYRQNGNVDNAKENDILNYAKDSGLFKAYNDAWLAMPKYIVQENKETYDDLLPRLDALAKRLHGTIEGVVDYKKWDAHITVELPFFEACNSENFALLSDMAKKTSNVSFCPSENGGIILRVRIDYFDEIGDKDLPIEESFFKDEKFVELLTEYHDDKKKAILSNPRLVNLLNSFGEEIGLQADEVYDWFEAHYYSDPEGFLGLLFGQLNSDEENENMDWE